MTLHFDAQGLKKVFNRRVIFQNISFTLRERQTLLISGRNGSGKSTLVKILSDVLSPTDGSISLTIESRNDTSRRIDHIGLVSPYLQLYDEFSAEENLHLACTMRGLQWERASIGTLLEKVFLFERRNEPVRTFSSGMKQRMKYAFALVHRPPILILDEPTSNLDADGVTLVKEIMQEQRQWGVLIVATNDLKDVDHHDLQVDLNVPH